VNDATRWSGTSVNANLRARLRIEEITACAVIITKVRTRRSRITWETIVERQVIRGGHRPPEAGSDPIHRLRTGRCVKTVCGLFRIDGRDFSRVVASVPRRRDDRWVREIETIGCWSASLVMFRGALTTASVVRRR